VAATDATIEGNADPFLQCAVLHQMALFKRDAKIRERGPLVVERSIHQRGETRRVDRHLAIVDLNDEGVLVVKHRDVARRAAQASAQPVHRDHRGGGGVKDDIAHLDADRAGSLRSGLRQQQDTEQRGGEGPHRRERSNPRSRSAGFSRAYGE
jgi:hypothetical protein